MSHKEVTPTIKLFRDLREEYEVCPHCLKEIGEKEMYMDEDMYMYHRPCIASGPIKKLEPFTMVWNKDHFQRAASDKDPVMNETPVFSGTIKRHVAGATYDFSFSVNRIDEEDRVAVDKPDEMPDDIWEQVHDAIVEDIKSGL